MSTAVQRRWLLGGAAVAAAAAGAGVAWWRQDAGTPQGASAAAKQPSAASLDALWALRLARPEGGELVMATLRGKPLVLNFWATWCPPCVREMPELDRFHRAYSSKGWEVVGLAIDGPTPVRQFLAKAPVRFAIGLAGLLPTQALAQGLAACEVLGGA